MFYVIPLVATKNTTVEAAQKKMRRDQTCHKRNSTQHKERQQVRKMGTN